MVVIYSPTDERRTTWSRRLLASNLGRPPRLLVQITALDFASALDRLSPSSAAQIRLLNSTSNLRISVMRYGPLGYLDLDLPRTI